MGGWLDARNDSILLIECGGVMVWLNVCDSSNLLNITAHKTFSTMSPGALCMCHRFVGCCAR